MPSVAQEAFEADGRNNSGSAHSISILAKKRRWDDSSRASHGSVGSVGNDVVSIYVHGDQHTNHLSSMGTTTFTVNTLSPSQQRKIIPLGSKRLCLSNSSSADDGRPLSISTSPSRAGRESALTHHNHHLISQSLTAPCHICHRRPRRKVDLDSLANCEGCGQRTCFVCLRECLGWTENGTPTEPTHMSSMATTTTPTTPQKQQPPWSTTSHGHRRMVCSRCCVERGEDGDVVCLGCVAVAGE
ncbi:hypothetical protein Sste5346_005922 [Sporothrix stenoceras]|uniref:Uncharacterized protein n=1 Tax=Sporothrix stenoceras TaxID=5173 RepID=A0ABR3Z2Y0_9PEZI